MPFLFKFTTLSHAALLGLLMMMTQLTTLSEAQALSSSGNSTLSSSFPLSASSACVGASADSVVSCVMNFVMKSASTPPADPTHCPELKQVILDMGCPSAMATSCAIPGATYDAKGRVIALSSISFTGAGGLRCALRIPPSIGTLTNLNLIFFERLPGLTGSLPPSISSLKSLAALFIFGTSMNGLIPPPIGDMSNLLALHLGGNNFTGAPDSLINSPVKFQILFPNPMTNIPYDLVAQAPISNMTKIQLVNFFNIKPALKVKRQANGGANSAYTLQDLLNMCPLNQITSSDEDIRAGCLGGIKEFCSGKTDLTQCYNYYETTFTNSVYRGLIPHCPSWKKGNDSSECDTAVRAIPSGSTFRQAAEYFREVLFGGPGYTPCYPDRNKSCKWRKGVKVPLPGGALFEVK